MYIVENMQGTMEIKLATLAQLGVFAEYRAVHQAYASLLEQDNHQESLKRALFIQWYAITEPGCFTGIREIDLQAELNVLVQLNKLLYMHAADAELLAMLKCYSSWEYVFQREEFLHLSDLQTFVAAHSAGNELPTSPPIQLSEMSSRGQMGAYWLSLSTWQSSAQSSVRES